MPDAELAYIDRVYMTLALDPIHVGTGEHQLERVDNSIIRDPGTNLPKIPGTTLTGAFRAYTSLYYANKLLRSTAKQEAQNCAEDPSLGPCTKPTCPVCVTYGFAQGELGKKGFTSMAQIFDARLLFFPVHSMIGPVWVTSNNSLRELVDANVLSEDELAIKLSSNSNQIQTALKKDKLNLGWFLLPIKESASPITPGAMEKLKNMGISSSILERLILVSDKLFANVVNSNLEIRTSTSIDPVTGSSKEGALFTYEAIPRSTVLWFNIVYKDPRNFKIDGQEIDFDREWIVENVKFALKYCEYLGVGGMVTRGMGRIRILNPN